MKKKISVLFMACLIAAAAAGCRNKQHNRGAENEKAAQDELAASYNRADSIYHFSGRIDTAAFNDFTAKALQFAHDFPHDTLAPGMLYRAGTAFMIMAKNAGSRPETARYAKQALQTFSDLQEKYPDDDNYRYCFWQRAIIYDDILGDFNSAEAEYRDFINRYPDDELTPQFRQYIELMGKSEEELDSLLDDKG